MDPWEHTMHPRLEHSVLLIKITLLLLGAYYQQRTLDIKLLGGISLICRVMSIAPFIMNKFNKIDPLKHILCVRCYRSLIFLRTKDYHIQIYKIAKFQAKNPSQIVNSNTNLFLAQ